MLQTEKDSPWCARDQGVMSTWYTGLYLNHITLISGGALPFFQSSLQPNHPISKIENSDWPFHNDKRAKPTK